MIPSARWFFVLACLCAAGCGPSQPEREKEREKSLSPIPEVSVERRRPAFQALKPYYNKDLTALNEDAVQELYKPLQVLFPGRRYGDHQGFLLRHIWEFRKTDPLHLLFEVDAVIEHPGSSPIRLTLLDDTGKALSETTFYTAWRCYLHAVKLGPVPHGISRLLILETRSFHGPDYHKQYYGYVGGRFDLVRIEDSDGKATRNDYSPLHFACGPPMPKQTETQWEADVLSNDDLRIMRAMVWLGGIHLSSRRGTDNDSQYESLSEVLHVRAVRARNNIATRLRSLAESKEPWLREAALLALNPKDEEE